MIKKTIIPGLFLLLALAGGTSSCSDILTVEPAEVLTPGEYYRDVNDADAAVRGLYGQLSELAPQLVVLNELRADLLDVTDNADVFLRQLSNHDQVTAGNPWANPYQFFVLINNCNDVLKNFKLMVEDFRMKQEAFEPRYADVVALRSYLYLQLVIHYGEVPYLTEPIIRIDDVKKVDDGTYPMLTIEQMVDVLLADMESLDYKGLYTDASLMTTMHGFNTRLMYIDKEYLLGELHLWKGNYLQAATYFRKVISRENGGYSGYNNYDQYKISFADVTSNTTTASKYNSRYIRYRGSDLESSLNHWPSMFREYATASYYNEWIWVMYYHETYQPSPFIDLFAYTGGKYLVQPSQLAMNNWSSQVQQNGFAGDFRGNVPDNTGFTGSYKIEGGKPVVTKFIDDFNSANPLEKKGKWYVWRAGGAHLRFCEAANRDNEHMVAYALMNNGIGANFPGWANPANPTANNDFTYRRQTNKPYPYNFDARNTDGAQIPPIYRGEFHRNNGLRNRVSLRNTVVEAGADSLSVIEQQILDENALELAFEGARWGDLVRMSLRNGDNSIIANRIADKIDLAGNKGQAEKVRSVLMDRANWFLPLKVE
jgi:starch-binding outer membrane protein, SusD/RagB family